MSKKKEKLIEEFKEILTSNKGFYIGDPCYALSKENYYSTIHQSGIIEINNIKMIKFHTANGDGCCEDEEGNYYDVDSGNLSVIPLELVDFDKLEDNLNADYQIIETNGKCLVEKFANKYYFNYQIQDVHFDKKKSVSLINE